MNIINSHSIRLLIIIFLFSACKKNSKYNLEKSLWKSCGDDCSIADVLDFRKEYLYKRKDSIYINWYQKDSLIGIIDTITYHYGERRLYVKNLNYGCIARYCEQ